MRAGDRGIAISRVVYLTASSLLLLAGTIKLFSGVGTSTALGAFELAVGVWLTSGYIQRVAAAVTTMLFSLFAAYASWLSLVGSAACGCMGKFSPSPHVMWLLDVFLLSGLIAVLLRESGLYGSTTICIRFPVRVLAFSYLLQFIAIWSGGTDFVRPTPDLSCESVNSDEGVADIVDSLNLPDSVVFGKWAVLFVDPSCRACSDILESLNRLREFPDRKVAVVLVGSNNIGTSSATIPRGCVVVERLGRDFPCAVPYLLHLADGHYVAGTTVAGGLEL